MRIKINDLRNQRFCVVVVFTGEKICSCDWIYRQQNIAVCNEGNFQAREAPSFEQK